MPTETTAPLLESDRVRLIDAKAIREKIKEKFLIPFVPSPMSPKNYVKNVGDRFVEENIVNMWKGFPRVPNLLKCFEESKTLWISMFSYYYVIYEITSENSYRPVEYVLEDFTTIPWYYAN